MTMRPAAFVFAVFVVATTHADQQRDNTAAATQAAASQGTGLITPGCVIDAQSQPVHRAIVTLVGAELPAGRALITDSDGKFSFDRLPVGHFTLSAAKPAFVKTTYGAMRPGGRGTAIALNAGQRFANITLTMVHGAAVTGTIRDEHGTPIGGLQVSVVSTSPPAAGPNGLVPRPARFSPTTAASIAPSTFFRKLHCHRVAEFKRRHRGSRHDVHSRCGRGACSIATGDDGWCDSARSGVRYAKFDRASDADVRNGADLLSGRAIGWRCDASHPGGWRRARRR